MGSFEINGSEKTAKGKTKFKIKLNLTTLGPGYRIVQRTFKIIAFNQHDILRENLKTLNFRKWNMKKIIQFEVLYVLFW